MAATAKNKGSKFNFAQALETAMPKPISPVSNSIENNTSTMDVSINSINNNEINTEHSEHSNPPVTTNEFSEHNPMINSEKSSDIRENDFSTSEILNMSLLITEEEEQYLTVRPIQKGVSMKSFFWAILKDVFDNPDYYNMNVLSYNKRIRAIKKTMVIPKEYKERLKSEAALYGLRQASFVDYAIDRYMKKDEEYQQFVNARKN